MAVANTITSLPLDRLLTTTTSRWKNKVAVQIIQANPLLRYLFESAAVRYDGGADLRCPVILDETANVNRISPYGTFATVVEDSPDTARYPDTGILIGSMKVSKSELAKNKGSAKVVSLLRSKLAQKRGTMVNQWSSDIFNEGGTSTPSNAMLGIEPAIEYEAEASQSNVVGGITKYTDSTNWVNRYGTITRFGVDGDDVMTQVHLDCSSMGTTPDIGPMDPQCYRFLKKLVAPKQREASDIWREGFLHMKWEETKMYPEPQLASSGKILLLTTAGNGGRVRHDLSEADFGMLGDNPLADEFEDRPGLSLSLLDGRVFEQSDFFTPDDQDVLMQTLLIEGWGICWSALKNQGAIDFGANTVRF